jgi:hypothetical protein
MGRIVRSRSERPVRQQCEHLTLPCDKICKLITDADAKPQTANPETDIVDVGLSRCHLNGFFGTPKTLFTRET